MLTCGFVPFLHATEFSEEKAKQKKKKRPLPGIEPDLSILVGEPPTSGVHEKNDTEYSTSESQRKSCEK